MRSLSSRVLFLCVMVVSALCSVHVVAAASPQGLYVAPATLKIDVPIESIERTGTITLKNTFATQQQFSLDVKTVDPYKNIVDLASDVPVGIKNNLSLDQTRVDLAPNQSLNIKITIKNTESLPPGGSYFSVVIRNVTDEQSAQKVTVQSAVSVPVYLIKEKGTVRRLELVRSNIPKISFGAPKQITLELKNTGNVPVTMHGAVVVSKKKQIYASATINEKSETVLPGQSANYRSVLKQGHKFAWPGKFQVGGQIRSDQQDIAAYDFKTKGMVVIPWRLVVVLSLVGTYFSIKRYKKWRSKRPTSHLDKVHSLRRSSR